MLTEELTDGAPDEGETFGFAGAVHVPDRAANGRNRQ